MTYSLRVHFHPSVSETVSQLTINGTINSNRHLALEDGLDERDEREDPDTSDQDEVERILRPPVCSPTRNQRVHETCNLLLFIIGLASASVVIMLMPGIIAPMICSDRASIIPGLRITRYFMCVQPRVLLDSSAAILEHKHQLDALERHVTSLVQDQLPEVILDHIHQALLHASKDIIGKRDFASLEGGGCVLPMLTTPPSMYQADSWALSWSLLPRNSPSISLTQSLQMNSCWCFKGSSGQLGIVLAELLLITHITIDHIPKDFTSNIQRAPHNVTVWGVVDGEENSRKARSLVYPAESSRRAPTYAGGLSFVELAHVQYDIHASNYIQTFPISHDVRKTGIHFGIVVAEIIDNWGGDSMCLYCVRVHGETLQ